MNARAPRPHSTQSQTPFVASKSGVHECGPNKKGDDETSSLLPSNATASDVHNWCSALPLYEQALRDVVGLWQLKRQLWKTGQEKFSRTSLEFRAIHRLYWSGPRCQIRAFADASECQFADKHGDALFWNTVDGTGLHSVTMTLWFCGTLPAAMRNPDWSRRTKRFSVSDLLLLGDLHEGAKTFM